MGVRRFYSHTGRQPYFPISAATLQSQGWSALHYNNFLVMEFHGLKGAKKNGWIEKFLEPQTRNCNKSIRAFKKHLKLMPLFKLFVVPFLISPHHFSVCGIPTASFSPLPKHQVLLCSPPRSQNKLLHHLCPLIPMTPPCSSTTRLWLLQSAPSN